MGLLKELETKYDFDVVDDFMTHFGVMSMSLEPLIVGLSKPETFESSVGEILRIFRNLHSASKFLGLEPVAKFMGLCLNLCEGLNEAKSSGCVASDELVDWLLLAADQIESYRRNIDNDEVYFTIINPKLIKMPLELIKQSEGILEFPSFVKLSNHL